MLLQARHKERLLQQRCPIQRQREDRHRGHDRRQTRRAQRPQSLLRF